MAGRTFLAYLHHQSVAVAVRGDGYDMLHISAGFALEPELLAGAGEKACQSLLHGDAQAFLVHIGQTNLSRMLRNRIP